MPATILQPQDQKFEDLVKASGSIIAALRGTAPFEMTFGPEKEQPDYVTHFTVRCYEDRVSFSKVFFIYLFG